MKLRSLPVVQTFLIEDEEYGNCSVTIRQATTGDVRARNELFAESSWVMKDPAFGEQEIKSKWNGAEVARFDAFKTLTDCDIIREKVDSVTDELTGDVEDWFEFVGTGSARRAKSQALFFAAWDALPPRISAKIYQKVLVVNPQFGGATSEGESSATSTS